MRTRSTDAASWLVPGSPFDDVDLRLAGTLGHASVAAQTAAASVSIDEPDTADNRGEARDVVPASLESELAEVRLERERLKGDRERLAVELRQLEDLRLRLLGRTSKHAAYMAHIDSLAAERERIRDERLALERALEQLNRAEARRVDSFARLPSDPAAAQVFLAAEARQLSKDRELLRAEWARLEAEKEALALRRIEMNPRRAVS